MDKTPYLQVVGMPREMGGKGAPKATVFGVLGHTGYDPYTRSLGGLVQDSKMSAPIQSGTLSSKKVADKTERHIGGPSSKTHIPGAHYAQVPYAGKYMSAVGSKV